MALDAAHAEEDTTFSVTGELQGTDAIMAGPAQASVEEAAPQATVEPYKQPLMTFSSEPVSIAIAYPWREARANNFFRSAKWCPDGSCILTQEEDRLAKIFALPPELAELSTGPNLLKPYLSTPPSPAALIGLEWYPFATSQRPETFCFLRSCRDVPVALIDGYTGKIRASYSIIDHQERFVGPQCMTFSLDGMKLYCGFESAIEVFDVSYPGNNGTRVQTSPSRKSREGQKGIISSIAFCPDQSGVMAVGSYGRSVYLYDASGGEPRSIRSLKLKDKQGSGVTQVKFHPTSPEILYTASRCANEILVWDTRNTKQVLQSHPRKANTNQRLAFDVDVWGKWLTTGDTDGNVHFFDTQDVQDEPAHTFKLSEDPVSSASLHPYMPCMLTSAGSRKVPVESRLNYDSSSSSSSSSDDESTSSNSDASNGQDEAGVGETHSSIAGSLGSASRDVHLTASSTATDPIKTLPASSTASQVSSVCIWRLF